MVWAHQSSNWGILNTYHFGFHRFTSSAPLHFIQRVSRSLSLALPFPLPFGWPTVPGGLATLLLHRWRPWLPSAVGLGGHGLEHRHGGGGLPHSWRRARHSPGPALSRRLRRPIRPCLLPSRPLSVSLRLVRPYDRGVLFEPAQPRTRPKGPCLGRWPGTKHDLSTARWPAVPGGPECPSSIPRGHLWFYIYTYEKLSELGHTPVLMMITMENILQINL
jgi:hypothetical protein